MRATAVAVLSVLAVGSAATGWRWSTGDAASASAGSAQERAGVLASGGPDRAHPEIELTRFPVEAEALRRGDCTSALAAFDRRLATSEPASPAASGLRLVAGLAAYSCERYPLAEDHLLEADAAMSGEFEDWRLFAVAASATKAGQTVFALAAWDRLLAEHRTSPLRARAFVDAVGLAHASGNSERAQGWIAKGLAEELPESTREALSVFAWHVATARREAEGRRAAARRLLVEFPFAAANLQAVDALRSADGSIDWARALTVDELLRRAARLLELGVVAGALGALDAIHPESPAAVPVAREVHLLRARALVADRQIGDAALALDAAAARSAHVAQRAEVAWVRSLLAAEQLATRRGRPVLTVEVRAEIERVRRAALWEVVRGSDDLRRREEALRALTSDLTRDDAAPDHASAMNALSELRRIAPSDLSGAPYLWNRGFHAYQEDDPESAIATWNQLRTLYPESRYSRAALYWSARAHDLAEREVEAQETYRVVAAADTSDFYRRHAARRLGASIELAPRPAPARAAWPAHPTLARARLLSDWGLEKLAEQELEAALATPRGASVPREAERALRALISARSGDRRKSLEHLRAAFHDLGSAHQERVPVEALELFYPTDFEPTVKSLSASAGISPALVFAIIHQESGFDRSAVSRSGARGLMQLMPPTARELARRLNLRYSLSALAVPETSVRLGTTYFRQVLEMFDGNVELALAGYNNGPFRIRRMWHGDLTELDSFLEELQYDETRVYVKRILALADTYSRLHPHLG